MQFNFALLLSFACEIEHLQVDVCIHFRAQLRELLENRIVL